MSHFAVCCPEVPGHANSMSALCMELQRRGHQITWIGALDGQEQVKKWGFRSAVIGKDEFPLGSQGEINTTLGRKSGLAAARYTMKQLRRGMSMGLRELPAVLRECGAEALIADECIFTSRTVAEQEGLPWMTICSALPFHPDRDLPLMGPFGYGTSLYYRLRNRLSYAVGGLAMRSMFQVIRKYRRQHDMPPYDMLHGNASRLATIAQITRDFDFPRSVVPDWFHYVGSLQKMESRTNIDFPFEKLDGLGRRPLIYASLGTLQNRLYPIFRKIAAACASTSAQLVISLGGGGKPDDLGDLPGNPLVVEFAPQLELIRRASLVITHAGMNTVAESIAAGVPMLAIPITNDQPAVAARVAWAGCGEQFSLRSASVKRIATSVNRILTDDRYAARSRALAQSNANAGGVERAADIIEKAMANNEVHTLPRRQGRLRVDPMKAV